MKSFQLQLKEEREHRTNESSVWAKTVADKSRLCEDFQTQVRELNNELSSVKRKQTVNIKVILQKFQFVFALNDIAVLGTDSRVARDQEAAGTNGEFS